MTTYYVKNGGSDGAAGTSDGTAWATFNRVYSTDFPAGDTVVLFKRGSVWTERFVLFNTNHGGSAGNYNIFGAYGDGNPPLFDASVNLSAAGSWTETSTGSNLWYFGSQTVDVGQILFNEDTSCGYKRPKVVGTCQATGNDSTHIKLAASASGTNDYYNNRYLFFTGGTGSGQRTYITDYDGTTKIATIDTVATPADGTTTYAIVSLTTQGDFFYEYVNDRVYMYSNGNPGQRYYNIRGCQSQSTIDAPGGPILSGLQYATVQDIDFKYCARHGFSISSCSNVTVERIRVRWSGGGYDSSTSPVRDGNGLFIWQDCQNVTVRNCRFSDSWETSVSYQSAGASSNADDIYVYNNIFERANKGFDIWPNATSATVDNYKFCNNVISDMGGSILWPQRETTYSMSFQIYSLGTVNSSLIKNNIVYGPTVWRHWFTEASVNLSGWDINYNCYYPVSGTQFRYSGTDYSFADWRTNASKDANSITSDPLLVFAANRRINVSPGSPCLNTGAVVSGINDNYIGSGPDIGCEGTQTREIEIGVGNRIHNKVHLNWNL